MKLGFFMQPLHPSAGDLGGLLAADAALAIEADRLGFDELWIGEHYSASVYSVTNGLMFLAFLIPQTRRIRLCAGVVNFPYHHPVKFAADVAMMDHLTGGRLTVGIGPGGLHSDAELFGLQDNGRRGRMAVEGVLMAKALWTTPPPFDFRGEFWQLRLADSHIPELGIGAIPKPLQRPHPDIAMTAAQPNSVSAFVAGMHDWLLLSAAFVPSHALVGHRDAYAKGAAAAGRAPDFGKRRLVRSIYVGDTDAEAEKVVFSAGFGVREHFEYDHRLMRRMNYLAVAKADPTMPDDAFTLDRFLADSVIFGSSETVARRLADLMSKSGDYGGVIAVGHEMSRFDLQAASMARLADEVMPRLRALLAGTPPNAR